MTAKPLVSILVPTFNEEKYIVPCLHSILSQDYDAIEVIVFDDCSTDSTVEKIRTFKDPRIRLIVNEVNEKHEVTWNRMLTLATGKYIKVLCSDDTLLPGCISKSVAVIENSPDSVMVFGSKKIIDADGRELFFPVADESRFSGKSAKEIMRQSLLAGTNAIGEPNNVLFRASVLEHGVRFRFRNYWMVDPDFYIQLARLGNFTYIPEPVACFRITLKSWSVIFSYRQAKLFRQYISQDWARDEFGMKGFDFLRSYLNALKLQLLRQAYYIFAISQSFLLRSIKR